MSADLAAGSKLYADKAKDLYRQVRRAVVLVSCLVLGEAPADMEPAGAVAKVHASGSVGGHHCHRPLVQMAVLLIT